MTTTQSLALWELCREGLPLAADEAALQWGQGQRFELTPGIRISRSLEALIDQCNWEVERIEEAA
jgi:hypothetical protein